MLTKSHKRRCYNFLCNIIIKKIDFTAKYNHIANGELTKKNYEKSKFKYFRNSEDNFKNILAIKKYTNSRILF